MAAKKKKKKAPPRPLSARTLFVTSLPRDMPIAEVIARGKKAGLEISKGLVSGIRFVHKERWNVAAPAKNVGTVGTLSSAEQDLLGLVLDIGYSRAASLLDQFRIEYFDALKRK